MAEKNQNEKITALMKKKQQLEERIKMEQNKFNEEQRKNDTRKKIIIGSYYMKKYENNMDFILKEIDSYLTRPQDRQLFNLKPLKQANDKTDSVK